MRVERKPIRIRELIEDYEVKENGEIRCYKGLLNPRPSYQREFVYDEKDQREVFKTLFRSFPLGSFYWSDNGDGTYELLDGQQRTLTIMNIVNGDVYLSRSEDEKVYWDGLAECHRDAILDTQLEIYVCSGDEKEKMDWFKTINIVGKPLTAQEIRSAVYSGPFVSDARKWFVDGGSSCPALVNTFKSYVKANVERQELLEKVLFWHADYEGFNGNKDDMITNYLRKHKDEKDASALWKYYETVIRWAEYLFDDKSHNYSSDQVKVDWGLLYNRYHKNSYVPHDIQAKVNALMENPEIEKKDGIYSFIFDGNCKSLSPRAFKTADKKIKYEEQHHLCAYCGKEIKDIKSAHADHKVPWSKGGRTDMSNLQILCVECNIKKSNEEEAEIRSEYSLVEPEKTVKLNDDEYCYY